MEERKNKDAVLLTVIGIATLLVAIVGATFAYFTAVVSGGETTSTLVITSSNGGSLTFEGAQIIQVENIYPRDAAWVTKWITVNRNNTDQTGDYTYVLKLNYTNSFNSGELSWTFAGASSYCSDLKSSSTDCATNGGTMTNATAGSVSGGTTSGTLNKTSTVTSVTLGTQTVTAAQASATGGTTFAYLLTISYPNQDYNQNYTAGNSTVTGNPNQGQGLTAWISVEPTNA